MKTIDIKIAMKTEPYERVYKGHLLTYENIEFGIPLKKEKSLFEFILLSCGNGFNGNGKRNMESLLSAVKRIGKHKFIKTCKNAITYEDNVKKNKKAFEHNRTFFDKLEYLNKIFGFNLKTDRMSLLIGRKSIDIFELEKTLGIADKDISMNDFITEKYGKDIAEKVKELI